MPTPPNFTPPAFTDSEFTSSSEALVAARDSDALDSTGENNGYVWFSGDDEDVREFDRSAPAHATVTERGRDGGLVVGVSETSGDSGSTRQGPDRDGIERQLDNRGPV